MSGDALRLPARAKVNLVLRVVGRRDDGYHLLETLFHALELHDDLVVAPTGEGIALQVTAEPPGRAVAADADNLVVRALRAFVDAAGHRGGFRAHLHKRIPHGAGLGGGSSDAAAALRLANELCGRALDEAALTSLARQLGADVPFFLRGGTQWGRGIGDVLEPARVAPSWFVLLVPPFGCPTAAVYKNHAAHWKPPAQPVTLRSVTGPNTRDSALRIVFCNDLERAAERVQPALADLRRRVVELGCPDVAMTGSGSTLFVARATEAESESCARQLQPLTTAGVQIVRTRSATTGTDVPSRVPRPIG